MNEVLRPGVVVSAFPLAGRNNKQPFCDKYRGLAIDGKIFLTRAPVKIS